VEAGAGTTREASTGPGTGHGPWTLVATGLGLFMIFLDATIVNVAIPDIQRDFAAGESGIQWVVAAYSLTMAMFMMLGGTVGDLRGRRMAYLAGLGIFALASLACALSPSLLVLAVSRGAQGVGAAVVNVASLALVSAAYPDPRAKARAIGLWTAVAGVGLAIGPTLGGVLTEEIGWESIFLFNPVVAALAAVLTVRFVAESRDPTGRGYDGRGQVLFVVAIGALTLALIEAPQFGWASPAILAAFALAVVGFVWFVRAELHTRAPMMDVRMFRDRVYSTALLAVFSILFCVYGTLFTITQYFQNVRLDSPERTGVLILAFTVPTVVLSPFSGRLAASRGGRGPTLTGLGLLVLATAVLAATSGAHLWVTLVGLALMGGAAGLGVAAATSMAMTGIAPERAGMASGILSSQRALGSTAGFAVMGSVLAVTVSTALPGDLETLVPDRAARDRVVERVVDDANPDAVTALVGPGKPVPDSVRREDAVLAATDDAFVDGIRLAELTGLVLALGALGLGWFVFPRRRTGPDGHASG
jgi:EmrB/QacA subfamily drug resistance transporter